MADRDELWAAFEAGARNGHSDDLRRDFTAWASRVTEDPEYADISVLDLPVRAYNYFRREGLHTVADVRESLNPNNWMTGGRLAYLWDVRGIGFKTVEATQAALARYDEEIAKR